MPTLEHNALVEMFREHPELAPRLLAMLFHVEVPPHAAVAVVESSLDQLLPVEFRADLVLELRDENDALVLAIVIEVQRDAERAHRGPGGARRPRPARPGARDGLFSAHLERVA